jgi:regulator of replication initiation timing
MIFSQIKIIAIAIAVVAFVGALWYVTGLRADLLQEQMNNKALQDSIEKQQDVIERMEKDFEDIREANRALAQEAERQKAEVQNLSDRLNTTATGRSRDFGLLAAERPRAIKRLVNRGTKNAMRCLELASGAKPTEDELAATLSSQINPECPSLANPNFKGES